MVNEIIETFNLSKIYHMKGKGKKVIALDDVNFAVKEGEKFGLLGPNGAGKTTTISILSTLIQPTSGYAIIDGFNILKNPLNIRSKVSLMLGSDMIYHRITGYANLKFFCKIYEIPNYMERIKDISKEFELEKWLDDYVEHYSTGMKVKLALCRALLVNPKILFLDEPTLGLDVKTTNHIVEKLKNLDKTIFLTSHNMDLVEKLCDRIAFINNGKIVKIGKKEELTSLTQQGIQISIEINQNRDKLKNELDQQEFIIETIETEKGFDLSLKERTFYKDLFSILRNYPIMKLREKEVSIEQLFLKLI